MTAEGNKRRSLVRFAEADDPIYKQGWTITAVGVWGRLPKPYPELAEPIKEADKLSDEGVTHEQE